MWGLNKSGPRGLQRTGVGQIIGRRYSVGGKKHDYTEKNGSEPLTPPSIAYQKPAIRASPFRRQYRKLEHLPNTTYPNPLFSMSKDEIRDLKRLEYENLATIPYKNIHETDIYCVEIVVLVNEIFLSDTKRAAVFVRGIKDTELKKRVWGTLRTLFQEDIIRNSILSYMITPETHIFQPECMAAVDYILAECDPKDASQVLLKYLDSLASVDKVNKAPIYLSVKKYDQIFNMIPKEHYRQFYSYLVQLNMKPYSTIKMKELKTGLLLGSNLDKYVYKTGLKDAKWHDTQIMDFTQNQKQKMTYFFQFGELKSFALYAIEKRNISEANLYIDLLVSKFQMLCEDSVHQQQFPSSKSKIKITPEVNDLTLALQDLLTVILNHIMTFKGSENCILILKYILNNRLEITFDTLLLVMSNLRKQGYYNEALTMIRSIPLKNKTAEQRSKLMTEIVKIIALKFPDQPKILVGYIAAFYKDSIQFLSELDLLSLVYKKSALNTELGDWKETVQLANVDERLRGLEITHESLLQLYGHVLKVNHENHGDDNIDQIVNNLFDKYIQTVPKLPCQVMDDSIVTTFLKYLLKREPLSANMELLQVKNTMNSAKRIFELYHGSVDNSSIVNIKHSAYMYDLLIYASLIEHNDYPFAAQVIRKSRELGVPFTFNQIYPFIMFHYKRNEFELAEVWYRELVSHGVKATSLPVKNIFKIARELKWDVSGFVYRKYGIRKNQLDKIEQQNIIKDRLMLNNRDKDDVENEITNELVGSTEGYEPDFYNNGGNLGDELLKVMYEVEQRENAQNTQNE